MAAHDNPFSMSTMLNTLQHLRLDAGRDTMIETIPERSSEKKVEQVEVMEVTHEDEVVEDWVGDLMEKYTTEGFEGVFMINTEDQQQLPVSAPSYVDFYPNYLEDNSLPMELEDDFNEDKEWNQEFLTLTTQDELDALHLQWMDQDGSIINFGL